MSDWVQAIEAYAARTGHELLPAAELGGLCLVFADGCDVCWLLPGEVLTTLPAPASAEVVSATIAEFERIERVRRDVLHVLRHYLASKDYGLTRSRSGQWPVQSDSGLQSSICVGA